MARFTPTSSRHHAWHRSRLTEDELEPVYIAYISSRFQQLVDAPVIDDTKTAASPPESRGF